MIQLSGRIRQLQASPIREILSVITRPGMISFAGGLPSDVTFDVPDFTGMSSQFLQYGPSEGEPALREQLCRELRQLHINCDVDQVLVLSGSQQGIDLMGKLVIDDGSLIALENPTYLAALQAFRFFGAQFTGYDHDHPEKLIYGNEAPSLCYVIPTFQNPSGHCYTLQERIKLAKTCMENGILLFEDDPYRDLMYEPCDRRPVCSYMQEGSWVYQGSFSKNFAPGLRLGFLVCSKDLVTNLTRLKQAADLHSNRLSQYWILQQLQAPERTGRIEKLQSHYRARRDVFAGILNEFIDDLADWQVPKGGLFFWLKLKQYVDTGLLLQQAIEHNVAFMPGEPFFHSPDNSNGSYLRLNFSHATDDDMYKGISILADLLRQLQS